MFVKIYVLEDSKGNEFSPFELFEHIGEMKLFVYLLKLARKSKDNIIISNRALVSISARDLSIAPATQIKYLALLVKKDLIIKGKLRGCYTINPKYFDFK